MVMDSKERRLRFENAVGQRKFEKEVVDWQD